MRLALNQSSRPSGDQKGRFTAWKPVTRLRFGSPGATSEIPPRLSPVRGCSAKTTRLPSGEMLGLLSQAGGSASYSRVPIGYSRRYLSSTTRITASSFPSGEKSAEITSPSTSRGVPPASGARAKVPM